MGKSTQSLAIREHAPGDPSEDPAGASLSAALALLSSGVCLSLGGLGLLAAKPGAVLMLLANLIVSLGAAASWRAVRYLGGRPDVHRDLKGALYVLLGGLLVAALVGDSVILTHWRD